MRAFKFLYLKLITVFVVFYNFTHHIIVIGMVDYTIGTVFNVIAYLIISSAIFKIIKRAKTHKAIKVRRVFNFVAREKRALSILKKFVTHNLTFCKNTYRRLIDDLDFHFRIVGKF